MVSTATPIFSIIVPLYNRAAFLDVLIHSVLNQSFSEYELIVVNDGSTDETELVIQKYKDARIRYLKIPNSERGAARNAGAEIAKGEYFNFFDSDDKMLPNHLEVAYSFVNKERTQWFHTAYFIVDESGNVLTKEYGQPKNPERRLIETNYLGCDSVFIHRNLYFKTKFDSNRVLASSEDWELWLRIISIAPLAVCPIVTLNMVNHASRSLLTISPDRIIERDMYMLHSLLRDENFRRKFKDYLSIFEADRYTFFSLVLIIAARRSESIHYFVKSFRTTFFVLKRRRFWACGKLILLSYFR